jgi:hypothetical protein
MLTDVHRETRKAITARLLHQHDTGGEGSLSQTVKGDETCVHHFEPKFKQQLMGWHHMASPRKNKFKSIPPELEKSQLKVFWDEKGIILVQFTT